MKLYRKVLLFDDEDDYLREVLEECDSLYSFSDEEIAAIAAEAMKRLRYAYPWRWWNRVGDAVSSWWRRQMQRSAKA